MQLKTIKTAADMPYKGVELVTVDKTITEVIIGKLRIKSGTYSGISVQVEVPGETVQRHRVTATLDGFGVKVEHFENPHQANDAATKFEAMGAEVKRDEVSVLVDELGEVVGDAPAPEAAPILEYIPF